MAGSIISGLVLTTRRALTVQMGGEIAVASTFGGVRFTVSLPNEPARRVASVGQRFE